MLLLYFVINGSKHPHFPNIFTPHFCYELCYEFFNTVPVGGTALNNYYTGVRGCAFFFSDSRTHTKLRYYVPKSVFY